MDGVSMFKRISVFYRYLVSYLGLVILACSLLGVLLFNQYVRSISDEVERVNRNKLSQIVSDLEQQYQTMRETALKISISIYYKPFYLKADKLHEQDLLDDFSKYADVSPVTDEYFFFYKDEDRLYKQNAKNSFTVYFKEILHIDESDRYIEQLHSITENSIIPAMANGQPVLLFAFPVSTLSPKDKAGQGVLCFVTSKTTLESREINVAGELPGRVILQYANKPIMTLYDNKYGGTDAVANFATDSSDGLIRASFLQDGGLRLNANLVAFQKMGLALIIAFSIILLALGTLLAYGNYRPIKRLNDIERSINISAKSNSYELDRIGLMLRHLAESDVQNKIKLKGQIALLIRQIVNLIIDNGYIDETYQMMQAVGMSLLGKLFCIFSIDARNEQTEGQESGGDTFYKIIEGIDCDGATIYPGVQRPNKCFTVLAILAEKMQHERIYESLRKASVMYFSEITVGVSSVYDDLNDTPTAYLESQTALNIAMAGGQSAFYFDNASTSDTMFWYDSDRMLHLIKALKLGRGEQAIESLHCILSQLQQCPRAVVIQQHVCYSILANIVSTMRDIKLPIENKNIIYAITMRNLTEFENCVIQLIGDICNIVNGRINNKTRRLIENVLEYINDHFTQYEISLENLEDQFGVTSPQLSKLIREVTGESFKSYLTHLRIEWSKHLLLDDNMSVHDVSSAVGYSSVSHFIHTFTKYTKCTPTQFKINSGLE
jgi:AraC-like DNA-binding protein